MVRHLIIGLTFCAMSAPVFGQSEDIYAAVRALEGTLSVFPAPMVASGRLTGCTIVFEHLKQDELYLDGNFIKVSGSLGLMSNGDYLGFMMKAIANSFDPATLATSVVDLSRVYLMAPGYQTNYDSLIESYPAETQGGILSAFHLDPGATMLAEAFLDNTITVAVGPAAGTSDILLDIDLTVVDTNPAGQRTRSNDTMTSFFECSERLLSQILD